MQQIALIALTLVFWEECLPSFSLSICSHECIEACCLLAFQVHSLCRTMSALMKTRVQTVGCSL